jgi:hypothetical protein
VKQMRFAFLEEEYGEPVFYLGPELEEDLVGQMAEAILEVFKRGGIGTDERDSEEQ